SSMVSVDDHVVEPPELWTSRLPSADHDRCPRVDGLRVAAAAKLPIVGVYKSLQLDENADGWIDIWSYEDLRFPMMRSYAAPGLTGDVEVIPITYDDMRLGCFEPAARLEG